jgi:hypothetical protein
LDFDFRHIGPFGQTVGATGEFGGIGQGLEIFFHNIVSKGVTILMKAIAKFPRHTRRT